MKLYEGATLIFFVIAAAVVIGVCSQIFFPPDNPVEQAAESVIKANTGVDVDLSPDKTPVRK